MAAVRHPETGQYTADPPLPTHADELMSSHEGRPTIAEQNVRNGAGIPAVDNGTDPEDCYAV